MNRYQFEDLISEYIEDELSLKKRKEFDIYLKENPDAQVRVDFVRSTINKMKNFPRIKANSNFNEKLLEQVKLRSNQSKKNYSFDNRFFGFSPLNATVMTVLLFAFIFISIQIFKSPKNFAPFENQFFVNKKISNHKNKNYDRLEIISDSLNNYAKTQNDSSEPHKKDYSKKMHFVND